MKTRLDKLLVERGLAPTRERAQAMVVAGRVLVNEQKVDKPGTAIGEDAVFRLLGDDPRYVGRGGLKLEAALKHWQIDLAGRFCVDVGASTGGFTDCMLQHGAARVLAIDTGYGQIAQSLRSDSRVSLMERTNARLLKPGELAGGDFVSRDGCFVYLGDAGAACGGRGDWRVADARRWFWSSRSSRRAGNMSAKAGLFAIRRGTRWRLIAFGSVLLSLAGARSR